MFISTPALHKELANATDKGEISLETCLQAPEEEELEETKKLGLGTPHQLEEQTRCWEQNARARIGLRREYPGRLLLVGD